MQEKKRRILDGLLACTAAAAVLWRVVAAAVLLLPLGFWSVRGRLSLVMREWKLILAFGLLGTVVDAWYAGAEGAAANRLITRSSISLTLE